MALVLNDGVIIISFHSSLTPNIFAVDINGNKGPNKWGHDLFGFLLTADEKRGYILTGLDYVEKDGMTTKKMIEEMHLK